MICPTCYGLSAVPDPDGGWRPCPADGCHAGQQHCCDGETAQPDEGWELEKRITGIHLRARRQYEHGITIARRKAGGADVGQG